MLVVYTGAVATSASKRTSKPFSKKSKRSHYNASYAYFLEACHKRGLRAAFTTTSDIRADGFCKSYWEYKNLNWVKSQKLCFSPLVLDKFSPLAKNASQEQQLFFSETGAFSFNDNYLHSLFDDKLLTYSTLRRQTIPTVKLASPDLKAIDNAIEKLEKLMKNHAYPKDFSGDYVLKDRFGAGGIDIYKINAGDTAGIELVLRKRYKKSFVLQPFLDFEKGLEIKGLEGAKDLRLIFCNGKLVQQYVRLAKKGDFRCNAHQGGTVRYIKKPEIPANVLEFAGTVIDKLNRVASIYALDFIVSNNGNIYFLEGNINPGLCWDEGSYEDETMTKELIQIVAAECLRRTATESLASLDELNLSQQSVIKIPALTTTI